VYYGLATFETVMIRSRRYCPCRCRPTHLESHHLSLADGQVSQTNVSIFEPGERFPLELAVITRSVFFRSIDTYDRFILHGETQGSIE